MSVNIVLFLGNKLQNWLHIFTKLVVLEVIYKLCPVDEFGAVWERGVKLSRRHVTLVAFDVLLVVPAQAIPRGGVEEEGDALENDGEAHVQVPVSDVVVQQAGTLIATFWTPEKASRVDPSTKDQRRGDETWQTEKKHSLSQQTLIRNSLTDQSSFFSLYLSKSFLVSN